MLRGHLESMITRHLRPIEYAVATVRGPSLPTTLDLCYVSLWESGVPRPIPVLSLDQEIRAHSLKGTSPRILPSAAIQFDLFSHISFQIFLSRIAAVSIRFSDAFFRRLCQRNTSKVHYVRLT
jgi:hypothetical protein